MSKIVIIANAEVKEGKILPGFPVTAKMVAALKQGIAAYSCEPLEIEMVGTAGLWVNANASLHDSKDLIYCALTIELPEEFEFPARSIYQACKDIKSTRYWVETNWGIKTSKNPNCLGDLWLPVVLTSKGPLYGEAICEGEIPNSYEQPVHLPDNLRQTLYHLAHELLTCLSAPPAVYLLQFSLHGNDIIFDRFWPFPAAPAIASIGVQEPDLFTCHWRCLTNQPILDLIIN